ncbi:Lsr2 family protein [Brevibacterium sp. R8603A2]|nr:Lsr2 family protein [Brevibacterium sp. R8603A2]QCP04049.1 Lsr2 family protein [Brevibacterium sp. CS2]
MAREMKLMLTDDIDGSEAAETVSFSLDQHSYEIELSSANAAKLREALAPYIEKARRVASRQRSTGRHRTGGGAGASSRTGADTSTVRAWAKANGHDVSDRGRIPAEVFEAYDAAH